MNFMSHGKDVLHDPWCLTGTQLPDLLRALERRLRLPHDAVRADLAREDGPRARLAAGVLRHVADDEWFHQSQPFIEICTSLTQLFRIHTPPTTRFRASFLAHILTEMMLDAWLMADEPDFADQYYAALATIDAASLGKFVAHWVPISPPDVTRTWERFVSTQFLRSYTTDDGVAERANGLFRRLGLPEIPAQVITTFPEARVRVYAIAPSLFYRPPAP